MLLRLVPQSQMLGRSASISLRVMLVCLCRRVKGLLAASPFFRRRPFGLVAIAAFFTFLAAFSRALIAVASREMWPTKRGFSYFSINASCTRAGNWLCANSAKAREKVASLGSSRCRSQPHKRRNRSSLASRSSNCRVVSKL